MAVNGTAEMKLANGTTAFAVTTHASDVKDAIAQLHKKLDREFDHCFEADEWQQVVITIKRL